MCIFYLLFINLFILFHLHLINYDIVIYFLCLWFCISFYQNFSFHISYHYIFKFSQDDILYSRNRTSGIVTERYNIDGTTFEMYDVGGQRNERRKWIHCFEGKVTYLRSVQFFYLRNSLIFLFFIHFVCSYEYLNDIL